MSKYASPLQFIRPLFATFLYCTYIEPCFQAKPPGKRGRLCTMGQRHTLPVKETVCYCPIWTANCYCSQTRNSLYVFLETVANYISNYLHFAPFTNLFIFSYTGTISTVRMTANNVTPFNLENLRFVTIFYLENDICHWHHLEKKTI